MNDLRKAAEALPAMPRNVVQVTRRIRRCEGEAAAQIVLEHFAHEYARAALAAVNPESVPVDASGASVNSARHPVNPTVPAVNQSLTTEPQIIAEFLNRSGQWLTNDATVKAARDSVLEEAARIHDVEAAGQGHSPFSTASWHRYYAARIRALKHGAPTPQAEPPSGRMDELRRSVAEIIGTDPETWPDHGNAPLAIAAAVALAYRNLKSIISHWNEFGPEHGFDELLQRIEERGVPAAQAERPAEPKAAVPQGWKLVPVEPTEAMLDAAANTAGMGAVQAAAVAHQLRTSPLPEKYFASGTALQQAYRAMLSASPAAPVPVSAEVGETAHTLGGFRGGFIATNGRPPTEQEIWNAAVASARSAPVSAEPIAKLHPGGHWSAMPGFKWPSTPASSREVYSAPSPADDTLRVDAERLLAEALVELNHAAIFVRSREKMHPEGVRQFDDLRSRIAARQEQQS